MQNVVNNEDALSIKREASSLRQQATDKIRETILSGRFAPGQKLLERELMSQLGVSRTVLREALQHLQAEGLISIIPHRGPMVAKITAEEARDIYQVRQNLESLAGEGFARNATDNQVHQLRAALEYLRSPDASNTAESLLTAKNKFYSILMSGCGNQVVGQLLTQLNNRVTLLRRMSLSHPGRLQNTIDELEEIVSAIEERDANKAGELCAKHVARAAEVVMRRFLDKDFLDKELDNN